MKEKEICIEVDEGLYNEILEIRGMGHGLVEIVKAGIEAIKTIVYQGLVKYRYCGEVAPFRFRWPDGSYEDYERALCFEVDGDVYYIAYGFREAFGGNVRRRVIVIKASQRGKPQHVLAEFAGADDWINTKLVAALLRKHDDSYVRVSEAQNIPEYEPLRGCIEEHAKIIKEGREGYAALVVKEDDYEKILYYAIKRLEMRRRKQETQPPQTPSA
jgi:hypothetical protein